MSSYLIYKNIIIPSFILFIIIYIISFIYVLNIDDWLIIWLGLELNILIYIIIIYKRYNILVLECCFKYLLIQRIGSALLLITFYLNKTLFGVIILLLRYKLGAGPFFYWFPSVCSGLNWIACYILITFQKIIPLFLISGFINKILWLIIILSLILGVFGSLNQIDIKQLLAYSSIHHLGWLITCILKCDLFWIWYLLIYSLMLIGLIYYLILFDITNIYMLRKYRNKWWFLIGILRIGGIPPLLGFFLKWVAFLYIISISNIYIIFLLLISVIILYIYLRIVYDLLIFNKTNIVWFNILDYRLLIKLDCFNFFGILIGLIISLLLII